MTTKLWTGWFAGVAIALGMGATAGTASAQSCATCEAGGPGGSVLEKMCSMCGLRVYPRSEKRYIRQFCQPTICPGSCFGYFKTQWTPWNQACPSWCANGAEAAPILAGPVPPISAGPSNVMPYIPGSPAPYTPPTQGNIIPPATGSSAPLPAPKPSATKPAPAKQPAAPAVKEPVAPPAPAVPPAKKPTAPPAKEPAAPSKLPQSGKTAAPIPVIPVQPISDTALTLPPVPDLQIAVPGSKPRS